MPQDFAQRPDATGSQPLGSNTPNDGAQVGTYFLGRYRVVDEIGIGGMASVHLGRMDGPGGFQKWVAIKRIHPHLIEDDSFVQMFLDEARVAARISHPNVATVFELGKHDDSYWIAMEYLHGEPLRELMRRTEELGQVMPPEIACRVIADAAEGLHAAHELTGKNGERLNLVHRDVTPHNLFVSYDGTTKVVDFGIAKFSSRMSSTRAGTLKGKLAYMSPEQVHGEQIDRRTDVFALGVVLWELTTGQRLFRMESDLDTLAKVQECNVPRPSTLVRGYPIDLEKIVMRALAKNRGERFKTAREFSRALQSLLMRRGLFIASDEVSAYVQAIFQERIQKREAHLRWAAEVTQTISIDRPNLGTAAPTEASMRSDSREPPRPAAGARPQVQMAAPLPAHDPSRHSPTVRPPARSDPNAGQHLGASGELVAHDDLELEDGDATIVTFAAKDVPRSMTAPSPAAGRLADSGETHAMPQQVIHRGGNPWAQTVDAQANLPAPSQPEFYPVPQQNGLGMNLMGARSSPGALGETLPMTPAPVHPVSNPYGQASSSGLFPAAPTSAPMIRLAPLEFGSADNRTVTAQALRRGMPIWMVALGAALVALLALAVLYVVVTHLDSTPPSKTVASGSSAAPAKSGAAPKGTTATPGVVAGGGGPFGAARAAFSQIIAPPPPPVPTASATINPTGASPPAETAMLAPPSTPTEPPPQRSTPRSTGGPSHSPARVASATTGTTGLLTIVCSPNCDQVIDNGRLLGPSPIFRLKVSTGEHRLQLKSGGKTKIHSANVSPGNLSSVVVNM